MAPKPVRVYIASDTYLSLDASKYVFRLLLKTAGLPYRFVKDSAQADITYGASKLPSALHISAEKLSHVETPVIEHGKLPFLVFPSSSKPRVRSGSQVCIENDIIFGAYYLLMGFQENTMKRSRYGDFAVEESMLYKNGNFFVPIVNAYSQYLRKIFATNKPVPLWPNGKKYALVLSHDIDYPEIVRPIEAARYVLQRRTATRLTTVREILFSKKQTFWCFDEWMQLESEYDLRSAFYFCAKKGSLFSYVLSDPDPFYDVASQRFKAVFNEIKKKGFEIGLHTSYGAYKSTERILRERKHLSHCATDRVVGNRHHYWHTAPNFIETMKKHEHAGFTYDCSLAFEKHSGFRRSIATPFFFFDGKKEVRVLEMPTALMDDQLFSYSKHATYKTPKATIDALLAAARRYEGLLVIDYHDRVLNETFFPGWGASYSYLLKTVTARNDYYSDTPKGVAQYWLTRDEKLEALSSDET